MEGNEWEQEECFIDLGRKKHKAMGKKLVRKENSIICRQKGWEMIEWNQKEKREKKYFS